MEQRTDTATLPRCSVAMATYNGAAFLKEQIDSILSQTCTDFELQICDDASKDGTLAILEAYAAKDPRVHVHVNEKNMGYRANFYKAISMCRADLIFLSDQDDCWLPHKMETLLSKIGDNLLVFSDSAITDASGKETGRKLSDTVHFLQPGDPSVNRGFMIGNCVWGHTLLFRRELLHYVQDGENGHPHDWWLAVVSSHLNRIEYCPEVLHAYRQHTENLTHAVPRAAAAGSPKPRRKMEEYHTQSARLASIRDLPFNTDRDFYNRWSALYLLREKKFPVSLFLFLFRHQRDVFRFKRKSFFSRLVEIRKMCRRV